MSEQIKSTDKLVALTIDDGPKVSSSNAILDIREKYGAHATFFVVGTSCNENTKSVLNRMLEAGCEIGNHSNRWSSVAELSKEEVLNDFNACQEKVYSLTGFYPSVYRAPGCAMSETSYSAIPVPVLNGHNIGTDWEVDYPYESRLAAFRRAAGDGHIILMHDKDENVPMLEVAIPELIAQGYKIVTATELYTLRGYSLPKYAQVQYKEFK